MARTKGMDSSWLWILGLGAVVYFAQKSGIIPALAQPTPYSIYPEFAYTAQTSMAATGKQKAPAAIIPPTTAYTSVQQQEKSALMSQMVTDWQLGL